MRADPYDSEQASAAVVDLIRASRAFAEVFPAIAPAEFLPCMDGGRNFAIQVTFAERLEVAFSCEKNGQRHTCNVQLAADREIN